MQLILLKDVEKVGRKGDVIRVSDGYARNFLLPRRLGLAATRSNQTFVEEQKTRAQARKARERKEAEIKAKELEQIKINLKVEAGKNDKLFGSITADDLRKALSEKGYQVDKRKIQIKEPIRTLGSYQITVEIYPQVKTSLAIEVTRQS